jgi:hypothetical protein
VSSTTAGPGPLAAIFVGACTFTGSHQDLVDRGPINRPLRLGLWFDALRTKIIITDFPQSLSGQFPVEVPLIGKIPVIVTVPRAADLPACQQCPEAGVTSPPHVGRARTGVRRSNSASDAAWPTRSPWVSGIGPTTGAEPTRMPRQNDAW